MIHASNARFSVGKRKIKWLMAVGLLLGLGARSFAQGAPLRKKLPDQILCTSADTKVKQNGLLKQKMLTRRKSFRTKLLARKTRPVRVSTN
jgi:hypothetical protein